MFYVRVCGNFGGGVFIKKFFGLSNMMIIRFDSEIYSMVVLGIGFIFIVEVVFLGL